MSSLTWHHFLLWGKYPWAVGSSFSLWIRQIKDFSQNIFETEAVAAVCLSGLWSKEQDHPWLIHLISCASEHLCRTDHNTQSETHAGFTNQLQKGQSLWLHHYPATLQETRPTGSFHCITALQRGGFLNQCCRWLPLDHGLMYQ